MVRHTDGQSVQRTDQLNGEYTMKETMGKTSEARLHYSRGRKKVWKCAFSRLLTEALWPTKEPMGRPTDEPMDGRNDG